MPTPEKPTLVLIVDDKPDNLDVLIEHLSAHRFKIAVALNGEDALELAQTLAPEAILLDAMMPGMDGFETCRRLKSDPACREIPILFMTALADIDDKIKGFEAGAVDYVTKPLQYRELLARLGTHLTLRRQQAELARQNAELSRINTELAEKNATISEQAGILQRLSCTDMLTGLLNRRGFLERLEREHARRHGAGYSLALGDIDHFKQFNDTYGHDCGDYVLQEVAKTLDSHIRAEDCLGRWGGEEFILLLPSTRIEDAALLAEKLRATVAGQIYSYQDTPLKITLTLGVAGFHPDAPPAACIKQADDALYQGKAGGRNQVRVARR